MPDNDVTALIALADEIDARHLSGAVRASDDIATRIVEALRSSTTTITALQAELEQAREREYIAQALVECACGHDNATDLCLGHQMILAARDKEQRTLVSDLRDELEQARSVLYGKTFSATPDAETVEKVARGIAGAGHIDLSLAIVEGGGILAAVQTFGDGHSDDPRYREWRITSCRGVLAYARAAIAALDDSTVLQTPTCAG